jgi:hypothetical protein
MAMKKGCDRHSDAGAYLRVAAHLSSRKPDKIRKKSGYFPENFRIKSGI